MTSRMLRRVLLAALLLPLGGCFVTSENPVLRAGEDGRDQALRGVWVSGTGEEILYVLRPELAEGEKPEDEAPGFSGLYVVTESEGDDARDNWTRLRMISTRIRDRSIISMRFSPGEGGGDMDDIPGWVIFTYEIRDGRLYLHMLDEEAVDAAIKAGTLKGRPKSESVSDPHVTASAAEWIAFLEKADLAALFDQEGSDPLFRLSAETIRGAVGSRETENQ